MNNTKDDSKRKDKSPLGDKPTQQTSQSDLNLAKEMQSNIDQAGSVPVPRTRSAVSMERRLSIALLAVLVDCEKAKLSSLAIETARRLVADVNEKVLKPITDRIAALKVDMKAATADFDKMDPAKVGEIAGELKKLEAKLKAIQSPATVS